jgi:glycerol-3-phosphate dehydrogenase
VTSEPAYDVAVIGAGVVGTAIARQLARYRLRIVVLERANDVGTGTSKANTAILHTGFDTQPGSLESALVRRGHELLSAYAGAAGIALEPTGAVLVSWDAEQAARLEDVLVKAAANRYGRAAPLTLEELYAREPHLAPGATGAVTIPDESIICPWSPSIAFATEAVGAGVEFRFGVDVRDVERDVERDQDGHDDGACWLLHTSGPPVRAGWVVNAAGLGSDLLNRRFGHDEFTVAPRRGQLIVFDKLARPLVSSIVLPVPTERTKGVLVAPTVYGNVLLGPTAEDIADPGDTATTAAGLDTLLGAGGRIVPALVEEEVTATYAGVRAATEHRDYQITIHEDERYACVGGIRSTGLTASLAIAEHVVAQMGDAGLVLVEAEEEPLIPSMPELGEHAVRPFEDEGRLRADPDYGRIVCFCERVTDGEVRDALHGVLPAVDLGGVGRRTRAANGRCQGFFCGAAIAARLAESASAGGDAVRE